MCFGNYWVYFENSRRRPLLVGNTDRAFWGKMKLHLHRSIQIKCKYNVKKNTKTGAFTKKRCQIQMRLRVTPLEHGRVGEMKQRSERPELPESPPPPTRVPPTRVAASSSVANLPASQMPARLVIQMLYKCDKKSKKKYKSTAKSLHHWTSIFYICLSSM